MSFLHIGISHITLAEQSVLYLSHAVDVFVWIEGERLAYLKAVVLPVHHRIHAEGVFIHNIFSLILINAHMSCLHGVDYSHQAATYLHTVTFILVGER